MIMELVVMVILVNIIKKPQQIMDGGERKKTMVAVMVKNVTGENTVMETCNIHPFVIVFMALEGNLAIGVLGGGCASQEMNPSTVL